MTEVVALLIVSFIGSSARAGVGAVTSVKGIALSLVLFSTKLKKFVIHKALYESLEGPHNIESTSSSRGFHVFSPVMSPVHTRYSSSAVVPSGTGSYFQIPTSAHFKRRRFYHYYRQFIEMRRIASRTRQASELRGEPVTLTRISQNG